jgi:hypothetical protein
MEADGILGTFIQVKSKVMWQLVKASKDSVRVMAGCSSDRTRR